MTQPTVLICGAGIAGPALAYWLTDYGYHVSIVEIAPGIRPGGQAVDLRGAGRHVVRRMGLMETVQKRTLDQRGAAWVTSGGRRLAEMPVEAFGGNGLISEVEILRGDLGDVLYQATADRAEYRFGTRIDKLEQSADQVEVTLSDGSRVQADLVVGADGPHSAVRRLVFGPEDRFVKPLGGYHAWFTAPDQVGLDGWYLNYQAPGGLVASMRPDHAADSSKAGLAFRSEPLDYDRHDLNAQRRLLAERFAGAGWECAALLGAARDADDFYFDSFAQVRMHRWSSGRVALVGDAGYCASPLSGMGTSLALVGAYILAGELGPAADGPVSTERLQLALDRYDTVMRPYVTGAQDLPAGLDGYAPMSAADIWITAKVMKYMQKWPFRSYATKKIFTKADAIDLPEYARLPKSVAE